MHQCLQISCPKCKILAHDVCDAESSCIGAAVKFLQPLVASIISTLRAPKSAEGYKSIGGGSPLRRITEEQANALAASLKTKGLDAQVYVGMRYWKPFTEEAIEQVGCTICLLAYCKYEQKRMP